MAEIRKGFSWASLVCFLGLVAIVAYLAWQSTSKEDTENYGKGSTHTEYSVTEHNYPLALPRCGQLFTIQNQKAQPKAKK